jgi:uncharacterized metal-binding protein YceD (DUF177 family)
MHSEFSRPVAIGALTEAETHRIEAGAGERAALAARFGLRGLDRLAAEVTLAPLARGVRMEAHLEAEVVQECVVTLEPVRNRVEDRFTILYGTVGEAALHGDHVEGEDPDTVAEPLDGDTIDIGEAVAQQLSLALDPYPRAPGAALDTAWEAGETRETPFAALAKLKKPGGDG